MAKLYLGEDLLEADSVSLAVGGRGFAFGFGVFETIKFIDQRPCFFSEHLARLRRAAAAAGLGTGLEDGRLRERAVSLFREEGVRSGVFKIVISAQGDAPLIAMFVRTFGLGPEPTASSLLASRVVKASRAFTSRHKSTNYMESVLELERAKSLGFDECVFFNELGNVTECAMANVLLSRGGCLLTPKLECGLLDGIVRGKVLELAAERGLSVEEGYVSESDLLAADEVFLTSSGHGPRSVSSYVSSDGTKVAYRTACLPVLREVYLDLERSEALSHG